MGRGPIIKDSEKEVDPDDGVIPIVIIVWINLIVVFGILFIYLEH